MNLFAPVLDITKQDDQPASQENKRTKPQQIGFSTYGRAVKHKVAVAGGEIGKDLFVTLAGFHLFSNLLFQVRGQISLRVGKSLILTNKTAELLRQFTYSDIKVGILGRPGLRRAD